MKKTIALLSTALTLSLVACYYDKADVLYPGPTVCDTLQVSYRDNIAPLIAGSCAISGCHNSAVYGGGYELNTYADLKSMVNSGRLLGAITHSSGYSAMPKGMARLSECDLAKITTWVRRGALDN